MSHAIVAHNCGSMKSTSRSTILSFVPISISISLLHTVPKKPNLKILIYKKTKLKNYKLYNHRSRNQYLLFQYDRRCSVYCMFSFRLTPLLQCHCCRCIQHLGCSKIHMWTLFHPCLIQMETRPFQIEQEERLHLFLMWVYSQLKQLASHGLMMRRYFHMRRHCC